MENGSNLSNMDQTCRKWIKFDWFRLALSKMDQTCKNGSNLSKFDHTCQKFVKDH